MRAVKFIRSIGVIDKSRYVVPMENVPVRGGTEDQAPYLITKLFTEPGGNAKMDSDDGEGRYFVIGLSLAPAMQNGLTIAGKRVNLCQGMSKKCAAVCLFGTGHARISKSVNRARVAKSRLWVTDRDAFKSLMVAELLTWEVNAVRAGKTLVVRLNVFSDIAWEREFPELFDIFPDVRFYDYTKVASRIGNAPANYHLTFSRSETNERTALDMLNRGVNVTVVFEDHSFPATWHGFPVIDGTTSDLRILDPSGVVVALAEKDTEMHGPRYAGKKNTKVDTSGFVLATASSNAHNQPVILA